jgi:hypothetical protein
MNTLSRDVLTGCIYLNQFLYTFSELGFMIDIEELHQLDANGGSLRSLICRNFIDNMPTNIEVRAML